MTEKRRRTYDVKGDGWMLAGVYPDENRGQHDPPTADLRREAGQADGMREKEGGTGGAGNMSNQIF